MNEDKSTRSMRRIVACISEHRFAPYMERCGGNRRAALALYEWNSRIGTALFEVVGDVEVSVRTALHRELEAWCRRAGWADPWFANPHGLLREGAVAKVDAAVRRLAREGRPPTTWAVIEALNLGFWRHLLASHYKTTLWPAALRHAFPALGVCGVDSVFAAMRHIHELRNRIAHHEPIHQRDLAADYRSCRLVLGAIDPELKAWVVARSRVGEVLAARPSE